MSGEYIFELVVLDKALDLDHNGDENTNLFYDMSCIDSDVKFHSVTLSWNPHSQNSLLNATVEVLISNYGLNDLLENNEICYHVVPTDFKFIVDELTGEINIEHALGEHYEREGIVNDHFYGKLEQVEWQNEYLYCTWRKQFHTYPSSQAN